MTPLNIINKLRVESAEKLAEANRIERLLVLFPDLKISYSHTDRETYYYSGDVNGKVTAYDIRYERGDCEDNYLYVLPYIETEYGKVYSDPPLIEVGESFLGINTYSPCLDWEADLWELGIPEKLIESVQEYFEKSKEEAIKRIEEAFNL